MQFSIVKMTTLVLVGLTGLALGVPATTLAAKDTLEKHCNCECNKNCQHDCMFGFIGIGAGACVLSCAPNCGCSEHDVC